MQLWSQITPPLLGYTRLLNTDDDPEDWKSKIQSKADLYKWKSAQTFFYTSMRVEISSLLEMIKELGIVFLFQRIGEE